MTDRGCDSNTFCYIAMKFYSSQYEEVFLHLTFECHRHYRRILGEDNKNLPSALFKKKKVDQKIVRYIEIFCNNHFTVLIQ